MAIKRINFDFFKVISPNSDFRKQLEEIQNMSIEKRNRMVLGNRVRLEFMNIENGMWLGTLVKVREGVLPRAAFYDKGVEDISLKPNQGIGEETTFLYDPYFEVIIAQYNHHGLKFDAMAEYFRIITLDKEIDFEIIIEPDAYRRLMSFGEVKKFEMKIAAPTSTDFMQGHEMNQSLEKGIELAKTFNAPNISVEISKGYAKEKISRKSVMGTVRNLLKQKKNVKKCRVTGARQGEVFDLIDEKLRYRYELNLSKNQKVTPIKLQEILLDVREDFKVKLDTIIQ